MFVIPSCTEAVCDFHDDLPVRLAAFKRFKNFVQSLEPALSIDECAVFLKAWTRRQYDIRKLTCFGEEDILYDEELKFFKGGLYIVDVRINDAHFLAFQVEHIQVAVMDVIDHFMVVQPRLFRQFGAP